MSVDLQQLHTFRLPAKAFSVKKISVPADMAQLTDLSSYIILAGGSNTLFLEDYQGTIVIPDFRGITLEEAEHVYRLKVGAAENWHELVCYCLNKGINGLENLALIPGTVGAAPVQNIGAYGVEVSTFISGVEVFNLENGRAEHFTAAQCEFGYRDSLFKQRPGNYLISHVIFEIPKVWHAETSYGPLQELNHEGVCAADIFERVIEVRQSKLPDPIMTPNAGSFFKNPVVPSDQLARIKAKYPDVVYFDTPAGAKLAAGWMIDHCGLKGMEFEGAAVHQQQALVLINTGQASGSSVINLCRHITKTVERAFGVRLEPEVRLIGQAGLLTPDEVSELLYE